MTVTPSPLAPNHRRSADSSPTHSHSHSHSQMSRNSSRKSNNSLNCKIDGRYISLFRARVYNTKIRHFIAHFSPKRTCSLPFLAHSSHPPSSSLLNPSLLFSLWEKLIHFYCLWIQLLNLSFSLSHSTQYLFSFYFIFKSIYLSDNKRERENGKKRVSEKTHSRQRQRWSSRVKGGRVDLLVWDSRII